MLSALRTALTLEGDQAPVSAYFTVLSIARPPSLCRSLLETLAPATNDSRPKDYILYTNRPQGPDPSLLRCRANQGRSARTFGRNQNTARAPSFIQPYEGGKGCRQPCLLRLKQATIQKIQMSDFPASWPTKGAHGCLYGLNSPGWVGGTSVCAAPHPCVITAGIPAAFACN